MVGCSQIRDTEKPIDLNDIPYAFGANYEPEKGCLPKARARTSFVRFVTFSTTLTKMPGEFTFSLASLDRASLRGSFDRSIKIVVRLPQH